MALFCMKRAVAPGIRTVERLCPTPSWDWLLTLIALRNRVAKRDITRLEIQLSFSRRAKHTRSLIIEFSLPPRDHNRGKTISNEIHAGPSHVHQFIDAKNYRDANRTETRGQEAIQRSKQDDQRCARHRSDTFGSDH